MSLSIPKIHTIHTSRTMMFDEISALIDHMVFDLQDIIDMNILGKQTGSNIIKSIKNLSTLYDFLHDNELWRVFVFLWKQAEEKDRRIMTLLYALYKDKLLQLSVPVVLDTPKGKKVEVQKILDAINKAYPERYAPTTGISAAQNMASSWKQAGYIEGKVRNIRIPVNPGFATVVFALYLGWTEKRIGEELLASKWMHVLELSYNHLKELLSQAAMRNLIHYQQAGGVTVIHLDNLIKQTEG
jgi:hypothetical protein